MMHVLICNIVIITALGVGFTAYGGAYVGSGGPFAVTCLVLGPTLLLVAAVGVFVVLPRAKEKIYYSSDV